MNEQVKELDHKIKQTIGDIQSKKNSVATDVMLLKNKLRKITSRGNSFNSKDVPLKVNNKFSSSDDTQIFQNTKSKYFRQNTANVTVKNDLATISP